MCNRQWQFEHWGGHKKCVVIFAYGDELILMSVVEEATSGKGSVLLLLWWEIHPALRSLEFNQRSQGKDSGDGERGNSQCKGSKK